MKILKESDEKDGYKRYSSIEEEPELFCLYEMYIIGVIFLTVSLVFDPLTR